MYSILKRTFIFILVLHSFSAFAQNDEKSTKQRPAANPTDVASIDALVNAMYDVISGAAGPRDWNRFFSLFLPEAQMGAIAKNKNGESIFRALTPESYQKGNAPFFEKNAFYEKELKRNISQFGNIATVESSYQFTFTPGGKVEQRGVNYITLVKSNNRWWIATLLWQDEGNELALPTHLQ